MGGAKGLTDAPEREQPGVGINTFGEPVQQDRQQLALQGCPPADTGGECLDMPHGALRVTIAQRGEAALGGLRRQPGVLAAEFGSGVEQGTVENTFVQFADRALGLLPAGQQRSRRRPVIGEGAKHRLCEGALCRFADGHQVCPPELEQLDAMFQDAKVPVRVIESGGVGPADVASGRECRYCCGGIPAPNGFVGFPVHQLEQLHGELHVSEAAAAEFDLPLFLRRRDMLGDPSSHRLHGLHEPFAAAELQINGATAFS
ncbi:hypothetical protein AHiyo4_19330 [Arthrobacter sp. Hiyo4]|nr:hypothetical protein AHiyo4_19330 [Arthrobacter sp. Hiyo4]